MLSLLCWAVGNNQAVVWQLLVSTGQESHVKPLLRSSLELSALLWNFSFSSLQCGSGFISFIIFSLLSFHFVAHLQPLEFAACYRNGYAHIHRYRLFVYILWLCIQLLAACRGGNAEDVILHTHVSSQVGSIPEQLGETTCLGLLRVKHGCLFCFP